MLRSSSPLRLALAAALAAAFPTMIVSGACSATGGAANGGTGGSGANAGAAGAGSGGTAASGGGGGTGGLIIMEDGGPDAPPDVFMNPCGTGCGPVELCDDQHIGLDDDCDGEVDEGCPCSAGSAHSCFKGDSSYHSTPGCFDGSMSCTENGDWGPCLGGVHATDNCFVASAGCHAISTLPFVGVDLKDGTGNFSADAVSESWSVQCPAGVNPCPAVTGANPADDFQPLQSGEYTVTYTKTLANMTTDQCTYPLFVGSKGLRVELEWEHDLGSDGVDLDLYVHEPQDTQPWSVGGNQQNCGYGNCKVSAFDPPHWFNGVAPPDPVEWYEDPTFEANSCYFSPQGTGLDWQATGLGCRNPRLDLDNITCNPAVVDVDDYEYCAPENINVDFPPKKKWMRVGVHYYSSHGLLYDVHPRIKIFCEGVLAAELGSKVDPMTGDIVGAGFYDPSVPITFSPGDGSGFQGNRFWMVADVAFVEDECALTPCMVKPLYANPMTMTPILTLDTAAELSFGPAYPPPLP